VLNESTLESNGNFLQFEMQRKLEDLDPQLVQTKLKRLEQGENPFVS
jgi:hypothetical protein